MTSASTPTPELRRQAALHFERAGQLIATGNHRPGIHLLLDCCRLDPANLIYRQALRRAAKAWFGNQPPRQWLAWLRTWRLRSQLRSAQLAGRYLDVLELGERILVGNPWDAAIHQQMAQAAESLNLPDLAIWLLEQARQVEPNHVELNRHLARRYESCGKFTQALALWELVRKSMPDDEEALRKVTAPVNRQAVVDEQLQAARQRLEAEPTQPAAYLELARLYRQAGRFDEARTILMTGLAATGNAFELTVELTELDLEPYRLDLAAAQRRLKEQPDNEELLAIASDLRREINTRELELYRLLADRYPSRLVYRYEVGLRLLRAGQLSEAMDEFKAVRTDASLHGPALVALAHGFRARQHPHQALKHFEEALACLPPEQHDQRLEVMYELARCHAELGELPRAVTLASELVRVDPGHRDISELLVEWRSRAAQAQAS